MGVLIEAGIIKSDDASFDISYLAFIHCFNSFCPSSLS